VSKAEAEALLRARLSDNTRADILGVHSTEAVRPIALQKFFDEQYMP
jgi:hypothetical protein